MGVGLLASYGQQRMGTADARQGSWSVVSGRVKVSRHTDVVRIWCEFGLGLIVGSCRTNTPTTGAPKQSQRCFHLSDTRARGPPCWCAEKFRHERNSGAPNKKSSQQGDEINNTNEVRDTSQRKPWRSTEGEKRVGRKSQDTGNKGQIHPSIHPQSPLCTHVQKQTNRTHQQTINVLACLRWSCTLFSSRACFALPLASERRLNGCGSVGPGAGSAGATADDRLRDCHHVTSIQTNSKANVVRYKTQVGVISYRFDGERHIRIALARKRR